jgi:valyl-tRNA synthetase
MREMARMALHAVDSGDVQFHPDNMRNMYHSWLKEENVRDWCISRQLWWGQRIPAWYYGEHTFVAETPEKALEQAREQLGKPELQLKDLQQDEDVLDTWFSSWLWPISVFDGFENQEELKYYYPTNVLVTGWDIMFFWVARMIMAGYEWSGELLGMDYVMKNGRFPFRDVYFTGMVRDNKRRKMSKSLGNSPEALELIARYGADGVRYGLLSCSSAGNDIIFDAPFDEKTGKVLNESKLCEQGLNFCNKMWNALRLIQGWEVAEQGDARPVSQLAVKWFGEKLQARLEELENSMRQYRLSEAVKSMYSFIWDDFCSWYLEMIKPDYGAPISKQTYDKTIEYFEQLMILLHPFMPFVTEEIWHQLRERKEGEDCIVATHPRATGSFDTSFIHLVDNARNVISKIREVRSSKGVKMKDVLKISIQKSGSSGKYFSEKGVTEMIAKLANTEELLEVEDKVEGSVSFVADTDKFFLEMDIAIDVEAERARITEELNYHKGFVAQVMKKLGNERFVNNAPAAVVDKERKKLADGEARIKALEESLTRLDS